MVNPLQPILWVLRQNEKDIINLYNLLTPFIQHVTKSNMLNFALKIICYTDAEYPDKNKEKENYRRRGLNINFNFLFSRLCCN